MTHHTAPKLAEKHQTLINITTIIILFVGCFLRLYHLTSIPFGLNQDEASIGYDAWSLANFGIDRNGYRFPVYPITWGSGGGSPLMVYLVALSEKLLGSSVFSVRIPVALIGCLTLILFTWYIRNHYGNTASLVAAILFCFNPWHLILSRWTVDCNMTPFFMLLAMILFHEASGSTSNHRTQIYIFSAIVFALCLYAYGSTTIVVPVYLMILCGIALKRKKLNWRQLFLSFFAFLVVVLPLAIFYIINAFKLPEILTPWFSINRLTADRSVFVSFDQSLPAVLWAHFKYLISICSIGVTGDYVDITASYLPRYWTMYRFTFPLTLLGFALCLKKALTPHNQDLTSEEFFLYHFLVSFIFSLFTLPGIPRNTLLFPDLIFFQVMAVSNLIMITNKGLSDRSKRRKLCRGLASLTILALFTLLYVRGAVRLLRDYFGGEYSDFARNSFMPGYADAVSYAESQRSDSQDIISTRYSLNMPYVIALFTTKTSPYDFINTAHYVDKSAEFPVCDHFTHFSFVTTDEMINSYISDPKDNILIVHRDELEYTNSDQYDHSSFSEFYVLLPREAAAH